MTYERALVITKYWPYGPPTGADVYSRQILTALAERFTRVDVVATVLNAKARSIVGAAAGSSQDLPNNVRWFSLPASASFPQAILQSLPLAAAKCRSTKALHVLGEQLAKGPDAVFIDHISASWSLKILTDGRSRKGVLPLFYIAHNNEYRTRLSIAHRHRRHPLRMLAHLVEAAKTRRVEERLARSASGVSCITRHDRLTFQQRYAARHCEVIAPGYEGPLRAARRIDTTTPRRLCVVGSFLWSAKKANLLQFLKGIAPFLRSRKIQAVVVGNMENSFRKILQTRWPEVVFTGPVPKVEPLIADARIGVVPESAGGGFKLKSLQYIFNRIPVFGLKGALEGLPLTNGRSAGVFRSAPRLVDGILRSIDDVSTLNAYQERAFRECQSFIGNGQVRAGLDRLLSAPRREVS